MRVMSLSSTWWVASRLRGEGAGPLLHRPRSVDWQGDGAPPRIRIHSAAVVAVLMTLATVVCRRRHSSSACSVMMILPPGIGCSSAGPSPWRRQTSKVDLLMPIEAQNSATLLPVRLTLGTTRRDNIVHSDKTSKHTGR